MNFFFLHTSQFLVPSAEHISNNTKTFAEKMQEQEEAEQAVQATEIEYLIPSVFAITETPSNMSNETIPFDVQASFQMTDSKGRWVQNVGTTAAPWVVTASLSPHSENPDAYLMGTLTANFVNGTATFTDIAISHNGTGYEIVYTVTYPTTVSYSVTHGNHTISEREFEFTFSTTLTDLIDTLVFTSQPSVTVYDKALGTVVNNTGWKNRTWKIDVELLQNGVASPNITGLTTNIINEGKGESRNLSISMPGTNYQLKLSVYTEPSSRYSVEHITANFNVSLRQFSLSVTENIGNCFETVTCNEQPTVQVRSVVPDTLARNLGDWDGATWYGQAHLCNANVPIKLMGTTLKTIPRNGELAFTDLRFNDTSANATLCFSTYTEPQDERFVLTAEQSSSFVIKKRVMIMEVETQPGKHFFGLNLLK